jgi:hypothetical protein
MIAVVTAYQPPPNSGSAPYPSADSTASTHSASDIEPLSVRSRANPAQMRPSSLPLEPRPLSPPTDVPRAYVQRSDRGAIYFAVRLLEKKNGAFFISRLILASGLNLRTYDSTTYDDPYVVSKLLRTLRTMLSETDLEALLSQTGLQTNR